MKLHKGPLLITAVATFIFVTPFCAASADPLFEPLQDSLDYFLLHDDAVDRLIEHTGNTAHGLTPRLAAVGPASEEQVRFLLIEQVVANLERKRAAVGPHGESFPLTEDEIRSTVIEYEAYKIESYVTSGVFPKRYFGYFDGKWETAAHEYILADTVHTAVEVINDWLAAESDPIRITDMEVALTWVSEGGTLLLGEQYEFIDSIHPIFGVGLDDIASGTKELAPLMALLDDTCGTDLGSIVGWQEQNGAQVAVLQRYMTFEESVVATALMWVWEKRIAQRKLAKASRTPLQHRPLDEQFILGSLVYNSGLIHDTGREQLIRDFDTGESLFATSERNAQRRARLNVVSPEVVLEELLQGAGYRDQHTSWLAVYHILQRWGGYHGMDLFTDVFDDNGMYDMECWEDWLVEHDALEAEWERLLERPEAAGNHNKR